MPDLDQDEPLLVLRDDGTILLPWDGKIVRTPRIKAGQFVDLIGLYNDLNNDVAAAERETRTFHLNTAVGALNALRDAAVGGELDVGKLNEAIEAMVAAVAAPEGDTIKTLFIDQKYAPWWVKFFEVMLGIEVTNDELDAWMLNSEAVEAVIGHWSRVPLALGRTPAQRAALEGRPMTAMEKRMDGMR